MTARLGVAEVGLVALEWPKDDIAPEYLRPELHAALLTAARREAIKLGGNPANTGASVYEVWRQEGLTLRFVWGAER